MMRKCLVLGVGLVSLWAWAGALAAAPGGAGPREGLLESDSLGRLGVGADYEWFRRDVRLSGGTTREVEARRTSGFISWDAAHWATLFATVGGIESRVLASDFGDSERRWSAGLHARLWHTDIRDPAFMEGRLSIDTTLEFSRSDLDDGVADGRWDEWYAAATVAYEIFVDTIENRDRYPFSLRLYAGPAVSRLDGKARVNGVRYDLEEATGTGLAWGAELFLSHNLSVGYGSQRFDQTTSMVTLRFRF